MSDYYEVPLDDVDIEKIGGFSSPKPGRYHGLVKMVNTDDPKLHKFVAELEVLAGTTADQEGRTARLFLQDPREQTEPRARSAAASKILTFAIALGLTTKKEVEESKKQKRPLKLQWDLAVGRQLCFEVESNEKTKTGTSIKDWGYWLVDDPACANIPRNAGMLVRKNDQAADPIGDAAVAAAAADDAFEALGDAF